MDSSGNVFIADATNYLIRKISSNGIITTIAGRSDGSATSSFIDTPFGVAVDNGKVYIPQADSNKILVISSAGIITTLAGNGIAGSIGDNGPAASAQLNWPGGVAALNGRVYIADRRNNKIRMVNSAGIITTYAGTGTAGSIGDNGPAIGALLDSPTAVAVDNSGRVFIADNGNCKIRMVNSAGIITTYAGSGTQGISGDDGPATLAQMSYWTSGIAVDNNNGNVFIADAENSIIRVVNSAGIIAIFAGTGFLEMMEGGQPRGIAIDSSGRLYIADGYSEIRMVFQAQPSTMPSSQPTRQPTLLPSLQQSSTVPVTWVSSDLSQDCISACGTLGSAYSCYLPAMWAVDSLAKTQALGCSGSYPRTLSDGWNGMVPFVSSMDPGDCYFNIPGQQQSTCEGSHIYRHRYCACSLNKNPMIQSGQPTAQPTSYKTASRRQPSSQPTVQPTGQPATVLSTRLQQVT